MSGTSIAGMSISQLPAATVANLTDLLAVTQGSSGPGTGVGRKLTIQQLLALASSAPYDIAMFVPGVPTASALLAKLGVTRNLSFPQGPGTSQAGCVVAPTGGTVVLTILKNATAIGTITYTVGSLVGAVSFTAATTFVAGDILTIVAPAAPDAAFAGPNWTFAGMR